MARPWDSVSNEMCRTRVTHRRLVSGWVAAVLLLLAASVPGSGCSTPGGDVDTPAAVLTFIQDDYAAALAQARERNVPLFIEAWAPW